MGLEIDLLKNYPKTKRNTDERNEVKTAEDIALARQFGKEFFDGDRKHGYGGFNYMPRFWQPVIPDFQQHYHLTGSSSVLDIGCAKGFMLHDMQQAIPGIELAGIDVSEYAIQNSKEEVKPFLRVGSAVELPYEDDSFDLVISINTVHNLERDQCGQALREISRVSRGHAFVTVDAWYTSEEEGRMRDWALTALTMMSVDEWKAFFREYQYEGDYFWFMP